MFRTVNSSIEPGQKLPSRRTLFTSKPVVTHYLEIPPDYKDETGLPYRKGELKAHEVVEIFGSSMTSTRANKLLRILHGRRVAGTLEDPEFASNTAQYKPADIAKALAYLRKTLPVDEVINAGLRAEDELQALEEEALRKERGEEEIEEEEETEVKDGVEKTEVTKPNVYGMGVIEQLRIHNIELRKAREAEAKRVAEEKARMEEEEAKNNPAGYLAKLEKNKPREMSPALKKYHEKALLSDLKEAPDLPKWKRLLAPTLFAFSVFGACIALSVYYTPPNPEDRLFPSIPESYLTVGTIMAMNTLVYIGWKLPPIWPIMQRFFIWVPVTPRVLAMLGATISHQRLWGHLIFNLPVLWLFGTRLQDDVGRGTMVATYVGSGVMGFLASHWNIILRNNLGLCSLGASGAIYGLAGAYFWLHKFEGFKVLELPPEPFGGIQGLGCIAMMVALNVGMSRAGADVVSHFGGLAFGIAMAELVKRRKEAPAEEEPEKVENVSKSAATTEQKGSWWWFGGRSK